MRLVSQLKASFISKDQGNIDQVPLDAFKETMRKVFQPFRQAEEIVTKIAECVVVVVGSDKQKMADSAKLTTLIEFMKCYPLMVKRDKNTSSGMDYVMDGVRSSQQRNGNNSELQKTSDRSLNQDFEYVNQLASLVLTRMEEKHRSITEVFRYMDQRGKGKVSKKDFF